MPRSGTSGQPKQQPGRGGRLRKTFVVPGQPMTRYRPPPPEECTETTFGWSISDRPDRPEMIKVRVVLYRGMVVDFAFSQVTRVDGEWVDVARVDCCGGTVHRHQFAADGRDLIGHELIADIPVQSGHEFVDNLYNRALDIMQNEWEDNLRRWRDGSR